MFWLQLFMFVLIYPLSFTFFTLSKHLCFSSFNASVEFDPNLAVMTQSKCHIGDYCWDIYLVTLFNKMIFFLLKTIYSFFL